MIRAFAGRHEGGRCVIVANGPSLNRTDLSFLRDEIVIGMNKIHLGLQRFGFHPRYYVAVNRQVIEQSRDAIAALNCVKFLGDRGGRPLPEDALTHYLNTTSPPARFCHDVAAGVHEGWTVTYVALQIARWLGFREVVLVGLDHRYDFEGAPNQLQRLEGPDPNHFDPAYFGGGQEWNNPDLARSEESYRIARDFYEAEGRRILDATEGGACKVFEKVAIRDLARR